LDQIEVAIVGAGFSGLCAAVELTRRGRDSFAVFERAGDVGGTWRDNTYPGVACDIPSHLYSFSFAPNANWSALYSPGAEIHVYLKDVVKRFDLASHIRYGHNVLGARWTGQGWELEIEGRTPVRARFLIGALGGLNVPKVPDLPGVGRFAGPCFHSSQWRHDVDLAGRRVGIIGTGATSVQAAPEVAKIAGELHVFQRSPVWALPKRDRPYTDAERAEFASRPALMRKHRWELWSKFESSGVDLIRAGTRANSNAERHALSNIVDNVKDPELTRRLTPSYNVHCKRPTLSDNYYQMFNQEHVHLVTDPVQEVDKAGIRCGDRHIPLDVLVLATGFTPFDVTEHINVVGLDGLPLAEAWTERIVSYRSVMVTGFPNFFLLLGPNSGGLTSAVQMIEAAARFAVDAIELVEKRGACGMHPLKEQMNAFTEQVDELGKGTTISNGCQSWWTDRGVNHSLWPGSSVTYRMLLANLRPHHFTFVEAV
jgi:cation diffusion facilitator CzcD-associated flavoprotein CzcO